MSELFATLTAPAVFRGSFRAESDVTRRCALANLLPLGEGPSAEWAEIAREIAVSDPDPEVRRRAVLSLAGRPGFETASILREFVQGDVDDATRAAAIEACGSRRDPAAVALLADAALRAPSTPGPTSLAHRTAAVTALGRICILPAPKNADGSPLDDAALRTAAIDALAQVLRASGPHSLQVAAAQTLVATGRADVVPVLLAKALEADPDPRLCLTLVNVLAEMKPPEARRALEDIARLADQLEVRGLARRRLGLPPEEAPATGPAPWAPPPQPTAPSTAEPTRSRTR
ncbi:MAG: HEAT repeat domain-containing protein [Planctomycetes bacterium]|nr:HEAT repeat domain-containing protein [Planctomycetota bacterium]